MLHVLDYDQKLRLSLSCSTKSKTMVRITLFNISVVTYCIVAFLNNKY